MASFAVLVASGFFSESCCSMSIPAMESCACAGEDCELGDCCASRGGANDGTNENAAAARKIIANFLVMIEPPSLAVIWLLIIGLLLMITSKPAENFMRSA